jgi:DNA invertase Pin-like site-specific DNA recombinase
MAPNVIPGTRRFALPDEEIAARYDAGEPINEIAASYGVSSPVIYTRLREQGRTQRLPRITAAQRSQILDLYNSGMSGAAVAKALGIARSSVRKVVRQAGMRRPTHVEVAAAHVQSDVVQEILRRRRSGEPVRALAHEYGIPRNTLARWLARAEHDSRGCA